MPDTYTVDLSITFDADSPMDAYNAVAGAGSMMEAQGAIRDIAVQGIRDIDGQDCEVVA